MLDSMVNNAVIERTKIRMQHEFIQLTFNQFFSGRFAFFISECRKKLFKKCSIFFSLHSIFFFETPPFYFPSCFTERVQKNVFFNIIIFLHNFTLTYTAILVGQKKKMQFWQCIFFLHPTYCVHYLHIKCILAMYVNTAAIFFSSQGFHIILI